MGSDQIDILFSIGKGELFSPENGFKLFAKRLQQKWSVASSRNTFSTGVLSRSRLVFILAPQKGLTSEETSQLSEFVKNGGFLLISLADGQEVTAGEGSINAFIEKYGMTAEKQSVIRNVFSKYFLPKEALISDGYLQKLSTQKLETSSQGPFLFPYGCTLAVKKPSVPLLTTGKACYPMHRPICGLFAEPKAGRIMVIGSTMIFHDNYIEKEENFTLVDRLVSLLIWEKLPRILPDETDVPDIECFPDVAASSAFISPICDKIATFSEQPEKIFDNSLGVSGLLRTAELLNAFKELKIPSEPLTLVAPKFESILPPLMPAVYPPVFQDLPRPELELFDFNLEFASEREKLVGILKEHSKVGNLDRYLADVGNALVTQSTDAASTASRDPKQLLERVVGNMVTFKKSGWMA